MTLTVRLDDALESSLERYCAQRGVTKSLVVQESLAAYLVAAQLSDGAAMARVGQPAVPVSANFRAFEDAGLIGAVALGQGADKAAVRERVTQGVTQGVTQDAPQGATQRKVRRAGT